MLCRQFFESQEDLDEHAFITHSKGNGAETGSSSGGSETIPLWFQLNYRCETCSLPFHSKNDLIGHITDDNNKCPPYLCKWCDQLFLFNKDWRAHVTKEHSHMKQLVCGVCVFVATTRGRLGHHRKKCHPDHVKTDFQCSADNERVTRSRKCNKTSVKTKSCSVCRWCKGTFESEEERAAHLREKHREIMFFP